MWSQEGWFLQLHSSFSRLPWLFGVFCVSIWIGKEYVKAIYCHLAYLTYMQSTSCEMLDWVKHKLESKLPGEILLTSDRQMTPFLWQKVKRNWKSESEVAQLCLTLCDPVDCSLPGSSISPWDFPCKSTGVGCHFLLQGDLPDPGMELWSPEL